MSRWLKAIAVVSLHLCPLLAAHADVEDLPILASPDSLTFYKEAVEADKKDADALAELGHAYLALDSLEQANRQFHRSIKRGKRPAAYYGLALSYWKMTKRQQMVMAFRIAPNLKNAIKRDPSFGPAYFGLAEWYSDSGMTDRLIELLEGYQKLRPEDLEGRYRLAVAHIENSDFKAAKELAEKTLLEGVEESRWRPFVAQGCSAIGDAGRALQEWQRYINRLPETGAVLYRDLRLIATEEEIQAISRAPKDSIGSMMANFWQRRESAMASGGMGREAEHYRRVWYANNFLDDTTKPWDLRGEVYISYGEPDYRSRSDRTNVLPSIAVANVKDKLSSIMFSPGRPGPLLPNDGINPIFPVGTYVTSELGSDWESWIYTTVGGGVEFVFEDELGNGRWRWPPVPNPAIFGQKISDIGRFAPYSPGHVHEKIAEVTPDYYDIPPGYDPLEFYYTAAAFRGPEDKATVDVYFGLPPSPTPDTSNGASVTEVLRAAALSTQGRALVDRVDDQLRLAGSANAPEGAFFPDIATLSAPPGNYQLSVQVSDLSSGKWGVYLQDLEVPDYTGSLAVSDIVVAFKAAAEPSSGRFRKGSITVVPMPSLSFRKGQHPSFYYEVYNLGFDEFGRTRYTIDYEIRRHRQASRTVAGFIGSGLSGLFKSGKPSFTVSYDRDGDTEWEQVYFELDTDQVEEGLNLLTVRITDHVSGFSAEKGAVFRLDK